MKDLMAARGHHHAEACKEVGVVVFLSMMPIWLNTVVMLAHPDSRSVLHNFWFTLQAGELYLYSTALLAPLYYFIFVEYGQSRFPQSRLFMILGLVAFVIATLFFTARRSLAIFSVEIRLDEDFIFKFSLGIYALAIILVYIAHVYKNLLASSADIDRTSTGAFVDEFRSRRERREE